MSYSSMKATKSGKRRFDTNIEISRNSSRKIKGAMKKSSVSWIVLIIVVAIGFAGGFFAHKYAFANDIYQMNANTNGEIDIYIGADEDYQTYTEKGVTCVAFGKDYSKDCTVKYYYRADQTADAVEVDKVDETVAGIYYAVYTTPAKKYASVELIRNIIVVGEEDNG